MPELLKVTAAEFGTAPEVTVTAAGWPPICVVAAVEQVLSVYTV